MNLLDIMMMKRPAIKSGPTFRSVGTAVAGSNPTVGTPPGFQAGDLLVLAGTGGQNAYSLPAGWSNGESAGNAPREALFYKFATGSETSVSVSNGGGSGQIVMLAYSGVTALDVLGTRKTASTATASTNSLTTSVPNALVISLFSEDTTGTVPGTVTGTTIRYADNTTGRSLVVVDEIQAVAGASTSRSCTFGLAASNAGFSAAFKP
jgi:hypothetical protein